MKTLKHSLSTLILMVVILISCSRSADQENIITVQDYRNQEQPVVDLESHKSGDVEIHRTFLMSEGYDLIYYHNFSGELQDYHAFYGSTDNYNKASYNWKDDTTVTIKLINSETEQEYTLELFGNGNTSGMKIED